MGLRWVFAMDLLSRALQLLERMGSPLKPCLTLVSTEWFVGACAVSLAEHAISLLASEAYDSHLSEADVSDPLTMKYLSGEVTAVPPGALGERLSNLPLYRLAKFWIQHFAQHVLSKVNRVHYGVVEGTSRKYAAIPFSAKDCPCMESEFSHPDVLIGLTNLGFRHSGLRPSDVAALLTSAAVAGGVLW